ncbi:hypothetical protein CONPUDRAFT_86072 [Coniophora puteana RWD-64-598 SS2]|uniref:Uncharacterized protein n=1 Tax=Coniophora puteana (strain RWD-64-598) TaxID=741705 RepID=R7SD42_CONPW|nr:uncharacterized protein CONPUDRAFT_86072 [Coniophora puteana RWD-64-598 SS2]EIW74083.1 hypothetical protein CONPUDRAFT_86072 [Coniophora puteana RWD-64-598 SS2]
MSQPSAHDSSNNIMNMPASIRRRDPAAGRDNKPQQGTEPLQSSNSRQIISKLKKMLGITGARPANKDPIGNFAKVLPRSTPLVSVCRAKPDCLSATF